MNEEIVQQIVDEILSSLEPLETQSTALLHFLKAKGLATDDELAPFLDRAANAANVRWRAVRVRTAALITNAMNAAEEPVKSAGNQPTQSASEPGSETGQAKQDSEKQVAEQPSSDKSNSEQADGKNKPSQEAAQETSEKSKSERADAATTKNEAANQSDVFKPNVPTKSDSPAKEKAA